MLTNHSISKLSTAPPSELQPMTGKWRELCFSGHTIFEWNILVQKDDFISPVSHAEALTGCTIKIITVLCVTEYMRGGSWKIHLYGNYTIFESKMLFEPFMGNFIFPSSLLPQLVTFLLELSSEMNIYFHFRNTKVKQISISILGCYFQWEWNLQHNWLMAVIKKL